jgi:hypothetical protein
MSPSFVLLKSTVAQKTFTFNQIYSGVLKVNRNKLITQIGPLEKRLRNGWRERQVTLIVSHTARP